MRTIPIQLSGTNPVIGRTTADTGEWTDMYMEAPGCMFACDEIKSGENCCIYCDYNPTVIAVLPGEHYDYQWNGNVYTTVEGSCSDCGCYTTTDPLWQYNYGAYITAYNETECFLSGSCPAVETTGIVTGLAPAGDGASFYLPFAIPYESDLLTIEITDPSDDICDDGIPVDCDMIPPTCDADYEILAEQNGCYQCVNPATCRPWGEPGCGTYMDCPGGWFCDYCGTSSCPKCSDCLGACLLGD